LALHPFPETEIYAQGFRYVAGLDEVGRGCIAGPVVAAACILPQEHCIVGLRDSKKLSGKQRESLYEQICSQALSFSVASVSAEEVDRINIHRASLKAMSIALATLSLSPEYLLIDGIFTLADVKLPQKAIVKGDDLSPCIAAASILAKVSRDHLMVASQADYPEFSFLSHKGYGTKKHYEELSVHGASPLHRKSFKGVE